MKFTLVRGLEIQKNVSFLNTQDKEKWQKEDLQYKNS